MPIELNSIVNHALIAPSRADLPPPPGLKAVYPEASYADLWTLAGATSITYMGGPEIAWSPGRTDSDKPTTVPDGERVPPYTCPPPVCDDTSSPLSPCSRVCYDA